MSLKVNLHDIEGVVVKKSQEFPIGSGDMKKTFLFLSCQYLFKGQPSEQILKFVTFSWGAQGSKFSNVLPGDVVRFSFTINGKMDTNKLDYMGLPSTSNDLVPSSKVEIVSTENRELYKNEPTPDDGLGEFPEAKFKYKDQAQKEEDDDPTNDLPF